MIFRCVAVVWTTRRRHRRRSRCYVVTGRVNGRLCASVSGRDSHRELMQLYVARCASQTFGQLCDTSALRRRSVWQRIVTALSASCTSSVVGCFDNKFNLMCTCDARTADVGRWHATRVKTIVRTTYNAHVDVYTHSGIQTTRTWHVH